MREGTRGHLRNDRLRRSMLPMLETEVGRRRTIREKRETDGTGGAEERNQKEKGSDELPIRACRERRTDCGGNTRLTTK